MEGKNGGIIIFNEKVDKISVPVDDDDGPLPTTTNATTDEVVMVVTRKNREANCMIVVVSEAICVCRIQM